MNETENQTRLRRAKESLAAYQSAETEARKALARAVESTRAARSKYEELFRTEETLECARLRKTYNHCTQ